MRRRRGRRSGAGRLQAGESADGSQAAYSAPSRLHSKRTTQRRVWSSLPLKPNVAAALLLSSSGVVGQRGLRRRDVRQLGRRRSRDWLPAPVLPAASVARTSKVCGPSSAGRACAASVQAANAAASTRHSKLAPASAENSNVGVASPVRPARAGVDRRLRRRRVDGEGAARGVTSALPAGVDGADFERVGAVGEAAVGLRRGAGRERGRVEAALECSRPARDENSNVGVASLGQAARAGVDRRLRRRRVDRDGAAGGREPVLPAASVARTSKVCVPSVEGRGRVRRSAPVNESASTRHSKLAPRLGRGTRRSASGRGSARSVR